MRSTYHDNRPRRYFRPNPPTPVRFLFLCLAPTTLTAPPFIPCAKLTCLSHSPTDAASSVSPSEDSTPTINDDGTGYTYYYRYTSSEEVISSSADDSSYTVDTGGTTSTYFSSDISSDDGATVSSSADDSSYTVDDDGTSSTDDTSVAPTDDGSKSVSSADESSTDSTNKVIAISASVGGALVLIAIVIGVTMCCFRPRCCPRKGETRQHETETPRALPVGEISRVMVKEDGGDKGDDFSPLIPAEFRHVLTGRCSMLGTCYIVTNGAPQQRNNNTLYC